MTAILVEPGDAPASPPEISSTPALSVRGLTVAFRRRGGDATALDAISFDIARAETLGVVGESGAGKSLTGLAVMQLLPPAARMVAGEISLAGNRIDRLKGEAMRRLRGARMGMIFQDPLAALNPLYTVGAQLAETIRAHSSASAAEARTRAAEWLDEVGVPAARERIDAYPHELSGGLRQRAMIALALCAEPELVIADEPTTALDVSLQAQIIELLKELCRRRGVAVMLISHDLGLVAEAADRIAVLYAGRIVETGVATEVVRAPLHPYAQGLVGALPALKPGMDRLVQIPGAAPRLGASLRGCAFHPRCPRVFARCTVERPALKATATGRLVACHLHHPEAAA